MKNYKVYDLYEGEFDLLGIYETRKEANARIKQQIEDTDTECDCIIKVVEVKLS